jgi:4-diphosphocytidyl-2-C-methyl-D-erythritol kinase
MNPRRVRIRALAKLNLDLRVLYRRPDGYHEIRTIFQTISLADALEMELRPARRTVVRVRGDVEIEDNLAARAAEACLEALKLRAEVEIRLRKRIPMGAGLGGGSSDAAAVLLALPALANQPLPLEARLALARALGSDVPFFLQGGMAAAVGRGAELYPLPDRPLPAAVLVTPGVHVATPAAYRALQRPRYDELTTNGPQNTIERFQQLAWSSGFPFGQNDFEEPVFADHPELRLWKRRLRKAGAMHAMMSGSGSAVFGLYATRAAAEDAAESLGAPAQVVSLVSRKQYQRLWRRWLAHLPLESAWPPQSR